MRWALGLLFLVSPGPEVPLTIMVTQQSYSHARALCEKYAKGVPNVKAMLTDKKGRYYYVPCEVLK